MAPAIETSSPGAPGLPPISAAARRAERVSAAMALAARLGRVPLPASLAPPRPVPAPVPAPIFAPLPDDLVDALGAAPVTPQDFRAGRLPVELVDSLVPAPSVPADFAARVPSMSAIIAAVAGHYGIARIDLLSHRRTREVVRPRQLAMWLAATLTPASLPAIGRRFGGRDHTTVLHARRATAARIATDAALAADAEVLIARLTGAAR